MKFKPKPRSMEAELPVGLAKRLRPNGFAEAAGTEACRKARLAASRDLGKYTVIEGSLPVAAGRVVRAALEARFRGADRGGQLG